MTITTINLHADMDGYRSVVIKRKSHHDTQWLEVRIGNFTLNIFGTPDMHIQCPLSVEPAEEAA